MVPKNSYQVPEKDKKKVLEVWKMPKYSRAEVSKHNIPEDAWVIFQKKVYNVTKFLDEHPGGSDILMDNAGLFNNGCI